MLGSVTFLFYNAQDKRLFCDKRNINKELQTFELCLNLLSTLLNFVVQSFFLILLQIVYCETTVVKKDCRSKFD
jgi:hypothetical protein